VPSIELRAIQKNFGRDTHVVRDLSLTVADGEFLTLLGPSGCGKSTILRIIAGLETPSAGEIMFDGSRMNDVHASDRNVAMVFQSYALYPHLTVRRNLEYPLRKRGVPEAERAGRIAAVADILKIGPLLDRRPAQLSGGQQQRVALGRAMIREPAIFLFDEPLSNLDATLRAHMRTEIIRLHLRLGKTMVYVTHDQMEAMTMSTRIAVLDAGRLLQLGTPADIYARPASRQVAAFVGTPAMNFCPGRIDFGAFHATMLDLVVTAPGIRPGEALAGVRPQDLLLAPDGLPARVVLLESTGQETLVTVQAGTSEFVLRTDAQCALTPGDAVAIQIRPGALHLFDPVTGERL
jgi:multiple sugar transport system ATP-binding protein